MKGFQYYDMGVNESLYSIVLNQSVTFDDKDAKDLDVETFDFIKSSNKPFSIYRDNLSVLTIVHDHMWLRIPYDYSFIGLKIEKDMKIVDAFLYGRISVAQGFTDYHVLNAGVLDVIPSFLLEYPIMVGLPEVTNRKLYAMSEADALEMRLKL